MSCKIEVKVIEARALPVMDSISDLTDAYVEIRVADQTQRTEIRRKTLAPVWNKKFIFELQAGRRIQDLPIEMKVYDRDVVKKDTVIGMVSVDCSPLIMSPNISSISGWFPIHDTMRGIRGELRIVIEIEKDGFSSTNDICHDMVVCSSSIPEPFYTVVEIIGFVEELRIKGDPEHLVKDKIRASRASNNQRKHVLDKLTGKLKRKIGLKVKQMGGNAILAYRQHFDLEEKTQQVIARAYGTASRICKTVPHPGSPAALSLYFQLQQEEKKQPDQGQTQDSVAGSSSIELLTLSHLPSRVFIQQAGVVIARSVKAIEDLGSKTKTALKRDKWWAEIRREIREHATTLACNSVLGYTETTTICEDVVLLSASGTAAYIKTEKKSHFPKQMSEKERGEKDDNEEREGGGEVGKEKQKQKEGQKEKDEEHEEKEKDKKVREKDKGKEKEKKKNKKTKKKTKKAVPGPQQLNCRSCHLPSRSVSNARGNQQLQLCLLCGKKYVSDVIISTLDPIHSMPICGDGLFIQARICHKVEDCDPDIVSEVIPFVEHDLHQQLMHKLRLMRMNAVFSLRSQIKLSPHAVFGILTGTAMYLPALPSPRVLEVPLSLIQGSFKIQTKLKKFSQYHQIANKEPNLYHPSHLPDFKGYGVVPPPIALPVFLYPEDQEGVEMVAGMGRRRIREEAIPQFVVAPDKQLLNEEKVARLFENDMEVEDKRMNTVGSLSSTMKDFISLQSVIFLFQFKYESAPTAIESHVFRQVSDRLTCHLSSPLSPMHSVCLMGLEFDIELIGDDIFQVVVTGMSVLLKKGVGRRKKGKKGEKEREREREEKDEDGGGKITPRKGDDGGFEGVDEVLNDGFMPSAEEMTEADKFLYGLSNNRVILSHLGFIPNSYTEEFLGRIHFNLIREKTNVYEGKFPKFAHNSLAECQSIARAHVAGLGGNALVSLHFDCVFVKSSEGTKQGYVLITLSGDAIRVRHQKEDTIPSACSFGPSEDSYISHSASPPIFYPPSPRTPLQELE